MADKNTCVILSEFLNKVCNFKKINNNNNNDDDDDDNFIGTSN